MKIILSESELKEVIHNALCNGLSELVAYGILLEIDNEKYNQTRIKGDCYEDVLSRMLAEGEPLNFYDEEGDEYNSFTLATAKENLEKEDKTIQQAIMNIVNEVDDATDADIVLQACIYGEVIFG